MGMILAKTITVPHLEYVFLGEGSDEPYLDDYSVFFESIMDRCYFDIRSINSGPSFAPAFAKATAGTARLRRAGMHGIARLGLWAQGRAHPPLFMRGNLA